MLVRLVFLLIENTKTKFEEDTMSDNKPSASKVADADMPIYGGLGMTFMQFPLLTSWYNSEADVVVSGVPYDMSTSGRSGARFGPEGVRSASINLVWEGARWPWTFALDDHLRVEDSGNVLFKHGEPQTLVDNLEGHIDKILDAGKTALTFGGDHFITLPILRAYAKKIRSFCCDSF
eukprot:TRINITY_DN3361_c0_g1_i1.p1 TRINITY_DN3361_c0_g1~~TRINITY_DN3361_c0_g1_i1.p1  ORF type:complete len:177 (-),score=24.55 TRINITY_DN3361_c0_g1_i1:24-554(-)